MPKSNNAFKKCGRCKAWKPVGAFYRRKGNDGYQYACKLCQNRGRDASGAYVAGSLEKEPQAVECLMCGAVAGCSLDNPFWLNQYSDTMLNYQALCSEQCFKRLVNVAVRMKRLVALEQES